MPDLPNPDIQGDDGELAELRALAGRAGPGSVSWETPPRDLWDRIAAGAHAPAESGEERTPDDATDRAAVLPLERTRRSVAKGGAAGDRHRDRKPWLLAAAAVVVGAVAAGSLMRGGSDDSTVVATGALDRLGDSGDGRAELVEHDGLLQLRLSTNDLDAGDGFLEVWVINPEVTQLVSLGPLRNDGVYDLPPGLDPASFPIVDVSVEPIDGDPTHSGDSVLRGELSF
ncbi:MAG: anti-sigma factor [Acidimicrobiia bacterium]